MELLKRAGRLFPPNHAFEPVATKMLLPAPPDRVWAAMMFYEEVPQRPAPLLRLFLPAPVRTAGAKTKVGATIDCVYEGGTLEKKITESSPPRRIAFDVTRQALGVEDLITMSGGSYEIRPIHGGSEIVLTTSYAGRLRPRWLFRPFEHYLAHQLHAHILEGMRLALTSALREEDEHDDGGEETGALPAPP